MHLDEPMRDALPRLLVEGALVQWVASVKFSAEEGPPVELVRENVQLTLDAVVQGGLAEDVRQAAEWLFRQVFSSDRRHVAACLPDTSTLGALAMLQGLMAAGLMLPQSGIAQGVGLTGPLPDGILLRWQNAFDVCSRTQAMQRVLDARGKAAPAAETKGSTSATSVHRRARAGI